MTTRLTGTERRYEPSASEMTSVSSAGVAACAGPGKTAQTIDAAANSSRVLMARIISIMTGLVHVGNEPLAGPHEFTIGLAHHAGEGALLDLDPIAIHREGDHHQKAGARPASQG